MGTGSEQVTLVWQLFVQLWVQVCGLSFLFTPLRGRVRPHQGYKVSYVLLVVVVVVVVVVVAPGQIFWTKNIKKQCI